MNQALRNWGRCLAVFLIVAGLGAAAADAPVLSRIVKSNVMRVGMTLDQPPLNAMDKYGEMAGLEVDLARLLAMAFDVELEIVELPFANLFPALKKGEVDMVMSGVGITAERALDVTFVGPYLLSGKALLTKSEELAGVVDAEDLADEEVKLAVLENSTSLAYAKKRIPDAELVVVPEYAGAIEMVRNDEVDAMLADMPICLLAANRYEDEGLKTLEQPMTIEPVGVAIVDADPKLRNLLQSYLSTIQDHGMLELLKEKWFEDSSWADDLK